MYMYCTRSIRLAITVALSAACPPAWAQGQTHEKAFDEYILRSNVVSSMAVSEISTEVHGIERAPDRAILNVTVMKKGSDRTETVRARVKATAMNLAGYRRLIPVAATVANGWVSYTGTFKFAPREVLDFTITPSPTAAASA